MENNNKENNVDCYSLCCLCNYDHFQKLKYMSICGMGQRRNCGNCRLESILTLSLSMFQISSHKQ